MQPKTGIAATVSQYEALFYRYFRTWAKAHGREDVLLMELFERWYEECPVNGSVREQLLGIARALLRN